MRNIRRKRLADLLKSARFNGDRSAFCGSAGISKGRLTQLLDPKEAFGDVAAKNLCDSLDLSQGWFDQVDDSKPEWVPLENPLQLIDALDLLADRINEIEDPEHREVIASKLQTMARAPDSMKSRDAVLQALAWSDAVRLEKEKNSNGTHG